MDEEQEFERGLCLVHRPLVYDEPFRSAGRYRRDDLGLGGRGRGNPEGDERRRGEEQAGAPGEHIRVHGRVLDKR